MRQGIENSGNEDSSGESALSTPMVQGQKWLLSSQAEREGHQKTAGEHAICHLDFDRKRIWSLIHPEKI